MATDEFSLTGPPPAREGPSRRRPSSVLRRSPWPWVALAAALVATAIITAPLPTTASNPWGQVADLAATPEEAWSTGGEISGWWLLPSTVVTATGSELHGHDPATGHERWTTGLAVEECTVNSRDDLTCVSQEGDLVAVEGESGRTHDLGTDGTAVVAYEHHDSLLVLAQRDGIMYLDRFDQGSLTWSREVSSEGAIGLSYDMAVIATHVLVAGFCDETTSGTVRDFATGEAAYEGNMNVFPMRHGRWEVYAQVGGFHYVSTEDREVVEEIVHTVWSDTNPEIPLSNYSPSIAGKGTFGPLARVGNTVVTNMESDDETLSSAAHLPGADTVLWRGPSIDFTFDGPTVFVSPTTVAFATGAGDLDRGIVALDAATGAERWRIPLDIELYGAQADDERLYLWTVLGLHVWEWGEV